MVAALARTITNRWASLLSILLILLGVSRRTIPRALRVKVLRSFWPCLARRSGILGVETALGIRGYTVTSPMEKDA
ncbi:hypothetical protein A4X03_0g8478 [Tilletia caries]|uniref:Uncharacterized protein n=1 Tax=Tilletia caries TaxID=13290 RepID=A0A177V8X0_9BASI|nr:hypothetical protein A4X03_0g8478 [Tilletia caries]